VPSRVPPIARIRLARSAGRLLFLPVLLILAGAALAAVGLVAPMALAPPARIALLVGGGLLGLIGLAMAAWLFSIRLEVEEAAVRLRSLRGERVYPLVPGPVTRVRLKGERASSLRTRTGPFGWAVGPARLRGEETIEIVRLASTASAILVPTERGRLAIAPASEADLIEALSRAARARQRLEELARVAPPPAVPEPSPPSAEPEPAPVAQEHEPEPEPRFLTGIERAELEERLAREGEAAAVAATEGITLPSPPAPVVAVAAVESAAAESTEVPPRGRWRRGGRAAPRIGRPRPSAVFVLLPLLGTGIVWGAATVLGRLPDPTSDIGRLTSLGLVLAGPATSVGAIMARAWWPRLVGVVVTSGLAAAVFVGRAVFGA
jgi:hypothetical protein